MTFGLPSRSPPIQVPKASGRAVGGSSTPSRRERRGQLLEHVRQRRSRGQLLEVVDGVARLVDRLGPRHPQLVGLPQQLDDLGQPAVRCAVRGSLVEQLGDPAQLGQDRTAGGLGRVGGEHRADGEPGRPPRRARRGHDAVAGARCAPPRGRASRPRSRARPRQLAAAVHLLGDVGQVEVRRERAHQLGRGGDVDGAEQLLGGGRVLAAEGADRLDQLEQLGTLLPGEGLAEQRAQPADVGAQVAAVERVVEGRVGVGHGRRSRSLAERTPSSVGRLQHRGGVMGWVRARGLGAVRPGRSGASPTGVRRRRVGRVGAVAGLPRPRSSSTSCRTWPAGRALEPVASMPSLRVLQTLTAGYDDVLPSVPPGVLLCNAPGVHDASTAELAVTLTLAALSGVPAFVRAADAHTWVSTRRRALADRRVLLVGYGGVGSCGRAPAGRLRGRPGAGRVPGQAGRERPGPRRRGAPGPAADRGRRGPVPAAHRRHPRPGRRGVPRPDARRRGAGERRPRRGRGHRGAGGRAAHRPDHAPPST